MDIKNRRRDNWPVEGNCPETGKGHGNQASDNNIGWDLRAQSWQRGADSDYQAIDDEKRESDIKFGVPYDDNLPNPGAKAFDGNATLPNPHNFSSNPGFMVGSSADMATSGMPRSGGTATISTPGAGRSLRGRSSGSTGTVGMTGTHRRGSVSLPAPGDVDPGQEGGPQVISSGYSG